MGGNSGDTAEWPVDLRGITETVVTTKGPEGRWNVAALGVHAGDPVTAQTWGRTRTRRNFEREESGHVQFTRDPVLFVEAALGITERETPVLPEADAWVDVAVEAVDRGESGGTGWIEWALHPVASSVESRAVPATNRGYHAVIEATVAASRLDVDAYDRDVLLDRLAHLDDVARRCGGTKEREAIDRVAALTDGWEPENSTTGQKD
ncbi:MAG: DUF447 domain-containing protein [Halobacteriales archaeon]